MSKRAMCTLGTLGVRPERVAKRRCAFRARLGLKRLKMFSDMLKILEARRVSGVCPSTFRISSKRVTGALNTL